MLKSLLTCFDDLQNYDVFDDGYLNVEGLNVENVEHLNTDQDKGVWLG